MTGSPATIAADEFARRRATASRKVAAGELRPSEANALVLPWLAIACRAGSDVPLLADDIADIVAGDVLSPGMARAVVADEICPMPRLRETLRTAAAAAIRLHEGKPTPDNLGRARGLLTLSRHFRAGPLILSAAAPASSAAAPAQARVFVGEENHGRACVHAAPEGTQHRSFL
jgi:hypothetical protein